MGGLLEQMVDFNNETTISTPASDVEKISILQRRYDLIEALEHYKKQNLQGVNASLSTVQARLISFFLQLYATLSRHITPQKEFEKLKEDVFKRNPKEEELLKVIYTISMKLDDMRLTRIDNETPYDSTDVEKENNIKGY